MLKLNESKYKFKKPVTTGNTGFTGYFYKFYRFTSFLQVLQVLQILQVLQVIWHACYIYFPAHGAFSVAESFFHIM